MYKCTVVRPSTMSLYAARADTIAKPKNMAQRFLWAIVLRVMECFRRSSRQGVVFLEELFGAQISDPDSQRHTITPMVR